MSYPKLILATCTIVVLFCSEAARGVEVQLRAQSRETSVGHPILIEIEVINAKGTPSIKPPIVQDVRILQRPGVSRSSQTIMSGGTVTRKDSLTYTYRATPSRPGRFTIPPFVVEVDGETLRTETIQFIATKAGGGNGDLLMVEIVGMKNSMYVGESLDVRLQIYIRPFVSSQYNLKLDAGQMWSIVNFKECAWGVFYDRLEEMYRQQRPPVGREVLHKDSHGVERAYYLYEINATLLRMSPGRFDFDAIRISMDYPRRLSRDTSLFGMGNLRISQSSPLDVGADATSIEVKPLPEEGKPAIFRGAVGRFAISARATPTEVTVGEPITLDITVRGTGHLDTLEPPPLPDIRELSDKFKVPNDPIGGVVEGSTKRFTQSIRARRDDITEIPGIPFAFFDPEREEYVVTRANPIPIQVKAADVLSATQIVDAAEKKAGPATRSLREVQSGILANYTGTQSLLSQDAFALNWLSLAALLSPPVVVLVVFVLQRRRQKLQGDLGFARRRSAKRRALDALRQVANNSDPTTAIAGALTGYVADRCNLPPGGLTRNEVREHLNSRGVRADLCERIDKILAQCETLQFAGGAAVAVDDVVAAAEKCVGELEKEAIGQ